MLKPQLSKRKQKFCVLSGNIKKGGFAPFFPTKKKDREESTDGSNFCSYG